MTKASKYSLVAVSAALIATAVYKANTDTPQPKIRAFAAAPTIRPKVITKGGHYSGTFVGNKDSAAIWIYNTGKDTVFIDSADVTANAGGGIRMGGYTIVVIRKTKIKGITPLFNLQYGRAIEDYQPNYLYLENVDIDSTGGVLIDHSKSGTSPLVQMYRMTISNTLGITGDGKEAKPRAGIQFNTVVNMNPASEAAWIEIRNDWMKSRVEDCFNFYNSSNFRFHDFCIKGAYNLPSGGKSLSGITLDGSMQEGNNKTTASHNFEAYNGYIISTFNAAMNIAAGYNNYMHDIVAVSSGMTPDGVRSALYWSGTCIFNGNKYPDSIFYGNRISGCTLGYIGNSGRQDENKDRNVNKMPVGGNKYLPEPITLATEDSVYKVWRGKFAGDVVPVAVPPVVLGKRDTVFVHDTFYYYITSRYGVVGIDTVKVKK